MQSSNKKIDRLESMHHLYYFHRMIDTGSVPQHTTSTTTMYHTHADDTYSFTGLWPSIVLRLASMIRCTLCFLCRVKYAMIDTMVASILRNFGSYLKSNRKNTLSNRATCHCSPTRQRSKHVFIQPPKAIRACVFKVSYCCRYWQCHTKCIQHVQ